MFQEMFTPLEGAVQCEDSINHMEKAVELSGRQNISARTRPKPTDPSMACAVDSIAPSAETQGGRPSSARASSPLTRLRMVLSHGIERSVGERLFKRQSTEVRRSSALCRTVLEAFFL